MDMFCFSRHEELLVRLDKNMDVGKNGAIVAEKPAEEVEVQLPTGKQP